MLFSRGVLPARGSRMISHQSSYEEIKVAKVMITETILRDAHQSQAATRMRLEDMLPACEGLDKAGFYSLECWGGATFDSCRAS